MAHTQQTSAGFYVITTWNHYLVNYTDFKVAPLIALAFRSDSYWGISGLFYSLLMHYTRKPNVYTLSFQLI